MPRALLVTALIACYWPSCALQAQDEPTKSTPPQTPDNASIDGEAVVTGKVDVQPLARDEEIEARLSQILKSTEWFSNATVDAENGVVFIQGETSQQQYKEWATKLAQQTQDVVAVVNRVDVVSGPIWNFTPAYTQLHTLWRSTIQSLPLVVVGIVILFLTFLATRLSSRLARSILSRQIENQLLRDVAAKAIAIPVFLVGLYIVLHVAGLTRLALTVLGGTGLAGLIIGIAFRDIAENFLASLLISVQNPFRTGDLIKVNEHLGIVQKVTTRGTLLMAYDGTYIQIPNSIVYKNIILNYTANSSTRLDFAIGIGYDVAIAKAQEVAQSALLRHPTVLNDPEPMVLVESLGAATVNIRVYFWINSQEHSPPRVISSAIRLVKRAFVKENISLPDEAREVVFPNGVPIQTMDMEAAKKDTTESSSRETFFEEEPDEVSTPAEGNLRSEKQDVEAQAETAREPEEGTDLLRDSTMSWMDDFKSFVLRGNLVDLAVGFTVGAAFSTVAKSLVNDLLMPPIGLALGGVDFSDLFITLKSGPENEGPYRSLADATAAGAVTLNYGQFANSVLSLLIVALAMFILIRIFMRIEQDGGQDAQRQLLEFVSDQASPSLADRVGTTLNEVQANAALNGPIGLISLLVTAVMIFAQFENAFDQIWNVDRSGKKGIVSKAKQVVWYRMRAFLMLLGAGALVMVTFFAGIAVTGASSLGDEFLHLPRTFWTALQLVVTLALNWGMFTLIYRILPKVPVRWSEAARGGLLASITWEIGRQILAALVIGNKYNAYGVVGAFIAIMLWVYYAMAVIFFCAEYVQVICNSYESGDAETEGNAA
ncbi:Large-conductance mechanosensitive channel [Durusdinium trenchii]|uniref:Large-conductance mechanosensitive channel n=1 Tax=Durusdinium trenchii TaxID=1381693 RepID=A0ABP0PYK8_9DINO